MKRTIPILLLVSILLLLILVLYKSYYKKYNSPTDQFNQPVIQPSFVLQNQQLVHQGYYSQSTDQASVKIVAKLIKVEQGEKDTFIVVDLSSDQSVQSVVKILVSRIGDEITFVLIKQKTRDFDAYSSDYIVSKPDPVQLVAELKNNINKLVLLVIPLEQLKPDEPKYSSVKHLIPTYNKFVDCNNQLFNLIKINSFNAWKENCQPRIYQIYVVE